MRRSSCRRLQCVHAHLEKLLGKVLLKGGVAEAQPRSLGEELEVVGVGARDRGVFAVHNKALGADVLFDKDEAPGAQGSSTSSQEGNGVLCVEWGGRREG